LRTTRDPPATAFYAFSAFNANGGVIAPLSLRSIGSSPELSPCKIISCHHLFCPQPHLFLGLLRHMARKCHVRVCQGGKTCKASRNRACRFGAESSSSSGGLLTGLNIRVETRAPKLPSLRYLVAAPIKSSNSAHSGVRTGSQPARWRREKVHRPSISSNPPRHATLTRHAGNQSSAPKGG
jgi:hypothetical protein